MRHVQLVDGVSERTEILRQLDEQIVRQIKPAYVLGQAELLRYLGQLVVGQVEARHALEVVKVVRQLRYQVVRHVHFVYRRHLHLGRRQLLELVVRQVQSDRQLVRVLCVLPDRVMRQVDLTDTIDRTSSATAEIARVGGHYAVNGHSKSPIFVLIEKACVISIARWHGSARVY